MSLQFVDSHAHLSASPLLGDAIAIIERAQKAGVIAIVNICTDENSLKEGIALQRMSPSIFLAAATTPHDVALEGDSFFKHVKEAAERGRLVAIGETGLDYHYIHSPIEFQKIFLIRYFHLAHELKLPLIFHCRDAFDDLFAMAKVDYPTGKAVLHCFTGTIEEARRALDLGWYISFSGIVTFKRSEALRGVLQFVPLDRIILETDAPYLAPQSKRGKTNEPAFIIETAQLVADLHHVSVEILSDMTSRNCFQFFSFPKLNFKF